MSTFPKGHSAHQQLQRNRKTIAKIDAHLHEHITVSIRHATQADGKTLRGIPAIGRGVAGVIPGMRPDAITTRDAA